MPKPDTPPGGGTAQDGAPGNAGGDNADGKVAPLRFRLAAMLYDALVILAMWIFTIVLLVTLTGDAVIGAWLQSLLFLELYAFFTLSWTRRGQTIGMLAWRLELRTDGRFTPAKALRRFVGGLLSLLTLGLGHAWMWFDPKRCTWPDRFSNSTVVRLPRSDS